METREVIGFAAATGAMVLLGSSVAAASALVDYPIAGGQALRYGLGAALLFALARGRLPRITRGQAVRLLALAASGLAGFNAFLIAALREADAASVGVIVGCVPVALALAGPLLERRPLSPRVVGAAAVVACGAGAVQWSGGEMSGRGLGLSLGALACEAAFSLLAVPLLTSLGPLAVSAYACLFAAPMLLVSSLLLDGSGGLPLPSAEEAAALAYLAALVTAAGFVLWYSSVDRLGVDRAGLFAGILPVAALLSAAAIGASAITPLRLVGALLVGVGVTAGMTARKRDIRADALMDAYRSEGIRVSEAASPRSSPLASRGVIEGQGGRSSVVVGDRSPSSSRRAGRIAQPDEAPKQHREPATFEESAPAGWTHRDSDAGDDPCPAVSAQSLGCRDAESDERQDEDREFEEDPDDEDGDCGERVLAGSNLDCVVVVEAE